MPICNGPKSTEGIREYLKEVAPGLAQPYICCFTSVNNEENRSAAIKAGMNNYLIKPIFKAGIQQLLVQVSKHH